MKRHEDPIIGRLRDIPLFAECKKGELEVISRNVTEHKAKAGHMLIREGWSGREFVVIVEGTANVRVGERVVSRLGPGDFFGEVALLDQGPRTATVVAETDVVAQVSNVHEFAALVEGAPTLARTLLVGLARRLRAADSRLAI